MVRIAPHSRLDFGVGTLANDPGALIFSADDLAIGSTLDGTLVAGSSVHIGTTGDIANSGSIAGRTLVDLNADNIKNLGGRIAANQVSLSALTDIADLGGRIEARDSLSLQAGRDIAITSTTASGAGQTRLDRVAGLYVTGSQGTLLAAAGRDFTLTAAEVVNAGSGSTTLAAGRDLTLATVTTVQRIDSGGDSRNHVHILSSSEVGSQLRTQGNATLLAGNDLTGRAADLQAKGDLTLAAGNDIVLAAGRNEQSVDITSHSETRSKKLFGSSKETKDFSLQAETSTAERSTLAGQNVLIETGSTGSLATQGSRITASQDLNVKAGTILLDSADDYQHSNLSISSVSKKIQQRSEQSENLSATGSVLSVGRNLNLESVGDTTVIGSALAAGQKATIKTGGDLALLAVQSSSERTISDYQQTKKRATTPSFEEKDVRQLLSTITVGSGIDIKVGGNLSADIGEKNADGSLKADRMTVGGIERGDSRQQVDIKKTGVGADANLTSSQVLGELKPQGIRNGANDSFTPTAAVTGNAALRQLLNSGLVQVQNNPQLAGQLKNVLGNTGGASLTYQDDSGNISLTVAGQAKVQEVFNTLKLSESFDTKKLADQSVAQVVTLVVAVVLTIYTGGAAAGTLGAAMVGSAGTSAAIVNAAIIGMSSTMVGQLAGGASFDKAFQAGMKAGATSAIMAGVSDGIDSAVNGSNAGTGTATLDAGGQTTQFGTNAAGQGLSKLEAMGTANYWEQTALNAAAKGVMSKAQGGSFQDGAIGSVLGGLGASGAGIIGDNTNGLSNIIAHAVLGCAVAAAGKQDCASGALGSAASASLARIIDVSIGDSLSETTRQAVIAGGAVGGSAALVGALGGQATTAGSAASNEVLNNYLDHRRPSPVRLSEKERYENAVAACAGGNPGACDTRDQLAARSVQRDQALAQACGGNGDPNLCNTLTQEARVMGNVVQGQKGGFVYANSPESGAIRNLNTATIGTPNRPDSFQDQVAKSTSEGLLLEGQNQLVGALIKASGQGLVAANAAVKDYFVTSGIVVSEDVTTRIALNFGRDGDRFTDVAEKAVIAKTAGWVDGQGRIIWPPGNGAVPGSEFQTTLAVGAKLDRYGGTTEKSSFLAPSSTPIDQRALAPSTNLAVHDEYIVVRPFQVEQSNVMPWFGKNGMGIQFDTKGGIGMTIEKLVEQGYLRKVMP